MRLEVLVENSDPEIYPLNKNEIIIGSGEQCDIVLKADGISRKHLKIINDQDTYYVADQGSINGAFINEERLIPGRRVEFTSFFPVRLADSVLLTLLSDEDASDYDLKEFASKLSAIESASQATPSNEDSTRVVKLADIRSPRTQELVQKRTQARKTRAASAKVQPKPQAKTESMGKWYFVAALILGGAVYYQVYVKNSEMVVDQNVAPNPSEEIQKTVEEKPVELPVYKVKDENLVTKNDLERLASFIKCSSKEELSFCNAIPELKQGEPYGAYLREDSIFFFLDQKAWLDKAVQRFPDGSVDPSLVTKGYELTIQEKAKLQNTLTQGKELATLDDIFKIGFLSFLEERVFVFSLDSFKNKNLYLVFIEDHGGQKNVSKVMSTNPVGLEKMKERYNPRFKNAMKSFGYKSGIDIEIFFNFY